MKSNLKWYWNSWKLSLCCYTAKSCVSTLLNRDSSSTCIAHWGRIFSQTVWIRIWHAALSDFTLNFQENGMKIQMRHKNKFYPNVHYVLCTHFLNWQDTRLSSYLVWTLGFVKLFQSHRCYKGYIRFICNNLL